MYNSDTELLFPVRVIPFLAGTRSEAWKNLVETLSQPEVSASDVIAFVLMMMRLGGCAGCNADSFRAMKGCTMCARQTIKRYRGNDQDLVELYYQTRNEVEQYLIKRAALYH